jgi:hypothetical protein
MMAKPAACMYCHTCKPHTETSGNTLKQSDGTLLVRKLSLPPPVHRNPCVFRAFRRGSRGVFQWFCVGGNVSAFSNKDFTNSVCVCVCVCVCARVCACVPTRSRMTARHVCMHATGQYDKNQHMVQPTQAVPCTISATQTGTRMEHRIVDVYLLNMISFFSSCASPSVLLMSQRRLKQNLHCLLPEELHCLIWFHLPPRLPRPLFQPLRQALEEVLHIVEHIGEPREVEHMHRRVHTAGPLQQERSLPVSKHVLQRLRRSARSTHGLGLTLAPSCEP